MIKLSIHVNQVLDYLDTHLICRDSDNVETLMEQLHEIYCMHYEADHQELYALFDRIRNISEQLGKENYDSFYPLICQLCLKHEQLAFGQGVLVGMMLMTEVNRLP